LGGTGSTAKAPSLASAPGCPAAGPSGKLSPVALIQAKEAMRKSVSSQLAQVVGPRGLGAQVSKSVAELTDAQRTKLPGDSSIIAAALDEAANRISAKLTEVDSTRASEWGQYCQDMNRLLDSLVPREKEARQHLDAITYLLAADRRSAKSVKSSALSGSG
jgi:hypothetical protein